MSKRVSSVRRWAWPASLLALALGCTQQAPPPTPPPEPAAPIAVDVAVVRKHIEFLASDAQGGRPPGTEADGRVQEYLEAEMKAGGLIPGFGESYRQSFSVTDGVRVKKGGATMLDVSGISIPHGVVPFSGDTSDSGPAVTKFVFVGYGLADGAPGTGDYAKIAKKVKGKVVVALHGGPGDKKLTTAELRPQTKVITARDHGAIGVVLWDPSAATPFHNHGDANDLGIPVVFVGADGNAPLVEAFTGKKDTAEVDTGVLPVKKGALTRKIGTLQTNVEPVNLQTANVAGFVKGDGSTDRVVVIGAHMDHLGMGTASSLAPDERAVHNGADDNASGVAVMLEVCRVLAASDPAKRPYDVMCMAFGAEEMGLLGSKHFVEKLDPGLKSRIVAMVNFDMVGRLREQKVMVAGVGTSSVWPDLVESHRGEIGVKVQEDGYGPSDHGSFYGAGIPVLHFFTGPHEDYHKPSDDIDKINFAGAKSIGDMALGIVATVLETKVEPDYKETERKTPATGQRQFRVSLGTIPDYAADVDGARLDGVRKGGAAEKAGMKKGDVIKKMGERDIHNFDDFMAMFAVLEPGKTIKVVVERDGKTVELDLTPGAPRPR